MKEAFSIFWSRGFEGAAGAGVALSSAEVVNLVADFLKEVEGQANGVE